MPSSLDSVLRFTPAEAGKTRLRAALFRRYCLIHSPYSLQRFVTRSAVSGSDSTMSGQPPSRV
jgi:hypothetical protein